MSREYGQLAAPPFVLTVSYSKNGDDRSTEIGSPDQPLKGVHTADTFVIGIGVLVQRQDHLGVVVGDPLQGGKLPCQGSLVPNAGGDLDILDPFRPAGNKIYFQHVDLSAINLVTTEPQLQINDAVKNVPYVR